MKDHVAYIMVVSRWWDYGLAVALYEEYIQIVKTKHNSTIRPGVKGSQAKDNI